MSQASKALFMVGQPTESRWVIQTITTMIIMIMFDHAFEVGIA